MFSNYVARIAILKCIIYYDSFNNAYETLYYSKDSLILKTRKVFWIELRSKFFLITIGISKVLITKLITFLEWHVTKRQLI